MKFPEPVREYLFDESEDERAWRFDFAWPCLCPVGFITEGYAGKASECSTRLLVALEIEGRGRHQTAAGYANDCEKYNAAQLQGWLVIRVPTSALSNDEWLVDVFDALKKRGAIV